MSNDEILLLKAILLPKIYSKNDQKDQRFFSTGKKIFWVMKILYAMKNVQITKTIYAIKVVHIKAANSLANYLLIFH